MLPKLCSFVFIRGFKSASAELQRLFDFPQQATSHREALPILQHDDVLSFEHGLEFLHTVEVHNGTSADTKKLFRVELLFEGVQRLTQDMTLFAGVDRDVVACGLD